ncbi:hypothetical protein GCM10023221_36470 [Luteimicrobium xylanilyticum]
MPDTQHVGPRDQPRLVGVLGGDHDAPVPGGDGRSDRGQHPAHPVDTPVQADLAEVDDVLRSDVVDEPRPREHGDGDRDV